MAVMRLGLGEQSLFAAGTSTDQPLAQLPFHFALGAVLGLVGAGYGWLTTAFLDVVEWLRRVPSLLKAGVIGMIVGATGWFLPDLIGGGETLAQQILLAPPAWDALLLILAVRILLGPLAYAAGAPGGLFAPLLVIGAASGALCSVVLALYWPALVPSPLVLSVVGMAAMFTAVVRAPLTGIVLTIEMTGRADCTLAMLTACLAATLLASAVGSRPIYDVLRERMLKRL
jgi:CIC family chloride channel protein